MSRIAFFMICCDRKTKREGNTLAKEKIKKEKPKKPKYNMWQNSCWMIGTAWRIKEKKVIFLCLAQVVIALGQSLVSLFISPAVISAVETQKSLTYLLVTILVFVGATMLLNCANSYVGENALYGRITIRSYIIGLICGKMMTTSYPNTEKKEFRDLANSASGATNNNRSATEAIWNTLVQLLKNVLGFAIYLAMLSRLDFWVIAVVLATSVVGFFVNKKVGGFGYRHRTEFSEQGRRMNYVNTVGSGSEYAKDLRIFGIKPWLTEIYDKAQNLTLALKRKEQNVNMISSVSDIVLTFLRNGIAYAYLINMAIAGNLSAAEFVLYFAAFGSFTNWVRWILGNVNTLHRQSLDISTVREMIEYPEIFRFEDGEALEIDPSGKYEIRLENVSFRYPETERDVLKNINLTLHPGEKLAVVGMNGAGKTTLVRLICGFYDPTEGRVLLNGEDIRKYNRRDYYKLFSAVFQDFDVIAATIAQNIAQDMDGNIDMDAVRLCADKAGLCEKIESLPEKYDTKLVRDVYEEAIALSGGETQRLMLARALYKNAPMLILDEPTAALDPIAEADMYKKYNAMAEGRSSIYISHRLASTRFCDRIILLDGSVIAEEGTHDELMALGGKYKEFFDVQSKYYKDGGKENEEEN